MHINGYDLWLFLLQVLVLPTRQLPSRTTLSERKTLDSDGNRRSSGIGWDSSLEDVLVSSEETMNFFLYTFPYNGKNLS